MKLVLSDAVLTAGPSAWKHASVAMLIAHIVIEYVKTEFAHDNNT